MTERMRGTPTGDDGLFAGRFRLSGLLGTGGDASVFAAVDVRTGAEVALKLLHPHLSAHPGFRDRFLAQARLAATVRHEGLVPVLAFGIDDEGTRQAWLAMPVVGGRTLADRIADQGPLPPIEAVRLVGAVLAALTAVHKAGMVHRDITPSNVMIEGKGERMRTVLLDLGLAGRRGEAATVGWLEPDPEARARIQGSIDSMSPEHLSGEPVDERGDVYQAGVLLYTALTGLPPFPRDTAEEVLRAHRSAPPPIASVARHGVPAALDRVIVRAMLKRPGDRYPSASAMADALARAMPAPRERGPELEPAPTTVMPVSPDAAAGSAVTTSAGPRPQPTTAPRSPVSRPAPTTVMPAASGAGASTRAATDPPAPRRQAPTQRLRALPTASRAGHAPSGGPSRGGADASRRSPAALTVVVVLATVALGGIVWTLAAAGADRGPALVAASSTDPTSASPPTATTAPPPPPSSAAPVATVAVPPLAGLSRQEAGAALAAAGLAVGAVTEEPSSSPRDTVLRAGATSSSVARGTSVDLVVASGQNAVPEVAGAGATEAADAVRAAGFSVALSGDAAGTVAVASPTAGTLLTLGQTVTLVLRAQVAPPEPTAPEPGPTATATPTPTPTPGAGR